MTDPSALVRAAPHFGARAVLVLATALLLATPVSAAETAPPPPSAQPIPAGDYTLDKSHASLVFQISHLGFSRFTARFTRFDARLAFDPARLTAARLEATIDPRSISSDNAPAGFLDSLQGAQWLDAGKFGTMSFAPQTLPPPARNACASPATSRCTA